MTSRKEYQRKMEEEFLKLSAKIDALLSQVEAKARKEYEALPAKVEAVRAKLKELKSAGAGAWEDMKPGLEKAWNELRTSFDKAASRFK